MANGDLLPHKSLPMTKLFKLLVIVGFSLPFAGGAWADVVYANDRNNDAVFSFDQSGNSTLYADFGSGATVLDQPSAITFDSIGNLYVASEGNSTIVRIDSTGTRTVFANPSAGVSNPTGLAFDAANNLYVSSAGGTITKFNPAGVGTTFASGLNQPTGLAFDTLGNLYVANSQSSTIEEFNPAGVQSTFASFQPGLADPNGLAFDHSGNLYVSYFSSNVIEKFNSSGTGTSFASAGLNGPWGLAFDSNGNLYAANDGNGTIEKFDSAGLGTLFSSSAPQGISTFLAIQSVPEPATWMCACLVTGLLGTGLVRRKHS